MNATTQALFGAASGVEEATAGSYGLAPSGYRLPVRTRLAGVTLQIADLERSLQFYEHTLGLRVFKRDAQGATLGAHGEAHPLVELREVRGSRPAGRGLLGLYHFAILLPDRASLGRFARHLAEHRIGAGAGDHLVSEALYLRDPDGLGIEVYADRPRDTWQRIGRELMLATDPVDINDLIASAGDSQWSGMPVGTRMGHVHLHVGDLDQAAAFFSDGLGFDRITWRYPGALFLGAGGYHHHLGTNTWAGAGARTPSERDARLLEWQVVVPTSRDVEDVSKSLRAAVYPVEHVAEGEMRTRDPWGTAIRVLAEAVSR